MKINIIIPVYNEEEVISDTLSKIISRLRLAYRIIIVNDGSSDTSETIIAKFAEAHPLLFLVLKQSHQGYACAIENALKVVPDDEAFVTIMADGCDEVALIEEMHRRIDQGADIVVASRYIKGGQRSHGRILKSFCSWLVNSALVFLTGFPCRDATNSFKMFRKKAVASIAIESRGFEIFMELILKAHRRGCRIEEIPTFWEERDAGVSHFSFWRDGRRYIKWLFFGLKKSDE